MQYSLDHIRNNLGQPTFERGFAYSRSGHVIAALQMDDFFEGSVKGSGRNVYEQQIHMRPQRPHGIYIEGECTCPVGHNCKHVAAVLIECLRKEEIKPAPQVPVPAAIVPTAVTAWIDQLENALAPAGRAQSSEKRTASHRLIFALTPGPGMYASNIVLGLFKVRLRKDGSIGGADQVHDVQRLLHNPPGYMEEGDGELIQLFSALQDSAYRYSGIGVEPQGKLCGQLLGLLLDQEKLYWAPAYAYGPQNDLHLLGSGPARRAMLDWKRGPRNLQLAWHWEPQADDLPALPIDHVLATDPIRYLDSVNLTCGELTTSVEGVSATALHELVANAPHVDEKSKRAVSRLLLERGLSQTVPMPEKLTETIRHDVAAEPVLVLGSLQQANTAHRLFSLSGEQRDYALIAFRYDGQNVAAEPGRTSSAPVLRYTEQGVEKIMRNPAAEDGALRTLQNLGFVSLEGAGFADALKGALTLPTQSDWLRFSRETVPDLAAQGWHIQKMLDYRYDVAVVEEWYADVGADADEPGIPWFDLELGIIVNQARVPLLPVLIELIRGAPHDFNQKALSGHADEDEVIATLPDGARVALPWGRIKPILNVLGELYFADKPGSALRLSPLDAARLAELEGATQMRWLGGQRLRALGEKLNTFGGIEKIAPPHGLHASLREYQSEGLAWLQFLREYGLAGILADDMGLGKTIQTLAHILIEKEAGRLTQPVLVVAPTSLMGNWQDEAARFAPDLKVLVVQGKERHAHFDRIGEFDLVLTTYALLPRDEDELRKHTYHIVILDEAHYIKNARAKATQVAALLRAKHRLCLTGTPLENHLGELWSQFNFLMPGLLGDDKTFQRDFRAPIEKQNDDTRRALLIRRIKPFILRRTKDRVAKELPPKTEIVRTVELSGAQRDLYETVRLAMDKKVRDEIAKKGVARSQIVILEALLKLRQVCCDPRLVKMAGTRKPSAAASAKLDALMEMLEELLEEDRKILLFSQFTSMLALVEEELNARKIPYALLTGDTEDRAAVVRSFQQGDAPLFLISLKAGGVGLNLTAADTVIHYDPWWNPAVENQATDRAWRIGQDKPVFVYKLIAKNTVEEKIQALQQQKAELARAILSGGEGQNLKLTQEDLQGIFAPLE